MQISLIILLICFVFENKSMASDKDNIDPKAFENSFFEPMVVSSLGIPLEQLVNLHEDEIKDLQGAKLVLMNFFKNLELPDGEPSNFMASSFMKNSSDRISVRKALVEDETTILQIALLDFHFSADHKSLALGYYAVMMAEGSIVVGEGNAALKKINSTWKIENITTKR
jgi:hypothetical protein